MTQKFVTDQKVKRMNKRTVYITLDCDWGFEPGDLVHITVEGDSRQVVPKCTAEEKKNADAEQSS